MSQCTMFAVFNDIHSMIVYSHTILTHSVQGILMFSNFLLIKLYNVIVFATAGVIIVVAINIITVVVVLLYGFY